MNGTPPAEVRIDAALVRRLLRDQHPDLADLAINRVNAGWDNEMYRLGDDLAVRMPRRAMAADLILNEQRWLPLLAQTLPIPIPSPVRVGGLGQGYPWSWSILPWFEGETANVFPPSSNQAERFADFLLALHRPTPPDAPTNPYRGEPLSARAADVEARMKRLAGDASVMTPAVWTAWHDGRAAPVAVEARWLHGDLHARNILVRDGAFVVVLDWGDITGGDVATDLASVWHLFDGVADRARVLERYGATADQVARARAWVVRIGLLLVETGRVDHPAHAAMGEAALRRLAQDDRT